MAMKNVGLSGKVGAFLFLFTGSVGLAQLPGLNLGGGGDAVGADFATMSKLFGGHDGFSAKSEVRMYDKSRKETISAAMNFAYLDNKTRIEIDATQMKNKDLPAGTADQLKQMGLDQAVTLIRPDKNTIYVMYPRLEACLTVPLPKKPAAQPKLAKEALGKETLDGHPCVKNKVTFTTDQGQKEELTVWNATDLKDFPVQVQARQNDDTVITRYKQIQLTKPDAKLFDLPAGFKEYNDTEAFMQGIMAKVLAGQVPKSK